MRILSPQWNFPSHHYHQSSLSLPWKKRAKCVKFRCPKMVSQPFVKLRQFNFGYIFVGIGCRPHTMSKQKHSPNPFIREIPKSNGTLDRNLDGTWGKHKRVGFSWSFHWSGSLVLLVNGPITPNGRSIGNGQDSPRKWKLRLRLAPKMCSLQLLLHSWALFFGRGRSDSTRLWPKMKDETVKKIREWTHSPITANA